MNPQLATRISYHLCFRVSVCSPISLYLSCITFPLYLRSTGVKEGSYKGHSIEWPLTAEQCVKVRVPDYLLRAPQINCYHVDGEIYIFSAISSFFEQCSAVSRWLAPEKQQLVRALENINSNGCVVNFRAAFPTSIHCKQSTTSTFDTIWAIRLKKRSITAQIFSHAEKF